MFKIVEETKPTANSKKYPKYKVLAKTNIVLIIKTNFYVHRSYYLPHKKTLASFKEDPTVI